MSYSFAMGASPWGRSGCAKADAGLSGGRAAALARLDLLSRLLDNAFVVPGTQLRFGMDGLIGLVPGIGDVVTTALSAYIVFEARRLGAPGHVIARMIGNVVLDAALGVVPVLGDAADMLFRANRRNMRILREHLEREGGRPRSDDVVDAEFDVVERRR